MQTRQTKLHQAPQFLARIADAAQAIQGVGVSKPCAQIGAIQAAARVHNGFRPHRAAHARRCWFRL
ncbi:MAG: hypothetical protein WDM79_06600 [Terricaulis sp.]